MVYRCTSSSISAHLGLRIPRKGSLSGLCVSESKVLRCNDVSSDARVNKDACLKVNVRSMICAPLFRSGEAVGVLKVMADQAEVFDSNDEAMLSMLAGTLGSALGNQLALDALKTSEETFRSAMENAPIGMAMVKPDGRFLKVNAALCELLGYDEAELLCNDFQSITCADDLERDMQHVRSALAGE